jgi:hypothetical protein
MADAAYGIHLIMHTLQQSLRDGLLRITKASQSPCLSCRRIQADLSEAKSGMIFLSAGVEPSSQNTFHNSPL